MRADLGGGHLPRLPAAIAHALHARWRGRPRQRARLCRRPLQPAGRNLPLKHPCSVPAPIWGFLEATCMQEETSLLQRPPYLGRPTPSPSNCANVSELSENIFRGPAALPAAGNAGHHIREPAGAHAEPGALRAAALPVERLHLLAAHLPRRPGRLTRPSETLFSLLSGTGISQPEFLGRVLSGHWNAVAAAVAVERVSGGSVFLQAVYPVRLYALGLCIVFFFLC